MTACMAGRAMTFCPGAMVPTGSPEGGGADVMTGGGQGDVFVFGGNSGADVITDYRVGQDHLQIGAARDVAVLAQGADTVITFGDDRVVLMGVAADQITSADFI